MVWLFVVAALGALMTSTVRYYSFQGRPLDPPPAFSLAIVLLCLFVAVVWKYSEVVLTLFASCYVVAASLCNLFASFATASLHGPRDQCPFSGTPNES